MWRRLLSRCHPDAGSDHDLFIWADALRDHVAGDAPEPVQHRHERRQPPRHHAPTTAERIPYEAAFDNAADFHDLTRQAVALAGSVDPVHGLLLGLLADCYEVGPDDVTLHRQQHQGATYKTLAAIAYAAGMSKEQRVRWYRICEGIPLSQRHAGHILGKLKGGACL